MAQLTVRNLPDDIAAALKSRAARAGRSAEAEHRRILEAALRDDTGADDFFGAVRERRVRLSGGVTSGDLLAKDRNRA